MKNYIDFANKNGIALLDKGKCQFCGANVIEGIKECVDTFNKGFDSIIDFYNPNNTIYKFLSVDAHTLQHSEIHGRWNNHLHLTRLHLIFNYETNWTYKLTPKLSRCLNNYKHIHSEERLIPPKPFERGLLTISEVMNQSINEHKCKEMIREWALEVYNSWGKYHKTIEKIAEQYIKTYG